MGVSWSWSNADFPVARNWGPHRCWSHCHRMLACSQAPCFLIFAGRDDSAPLSCFFPGLIILRRGNQNDSVASYGLGPLVLWSISCGQGCRAFLREKQLFQACPIKIKEFKWVADSSELCLSARVSGGERAKVEIWTEWVGTEDLLSGSTEEWKESFIRIRIYNQEWWEVRWALSLETIRGS